MSYVTQIVLLQVLSLFRESQGPLVLVSPPSTKKILALDGEGGGIPSQGAPALAFSSVAYQLLSQEACLFLPTSPKAMSHTYPTNMVSRPHLLPHQPYFFILSSLAFIYGGLGAVLSPSSKHPGRTHCSGRTDGVAPVGTHLREGQGTSKEGCWEKPGRARTTASDIVGEAAFRICPRP